MLESDSTRQERKSQLETIINDPTTTDQERREAYIELGIPEPNRPGQEQVQVDEDVILERYLTNFDREWFRSLPEPTQRLCETFTEIKIGAIDWTTGQLDTLLAIYKRTKSAVLRGEVRDHVRALSAAASLPQWRDDEAKKRADEFMEQTQ